MNTGRKAVMEPTTEPAALTLVVDGMSCGHCKVAVTDEVSAVAGVDAVEVDLDTKLVRVHGTDVDPAAVVSAIDDAGYDAVPS
jgi:copper chaperone